MVSAKLPERCAVLVRTALALPWISGGVERPASTRYNVFWQRMTALPISDVRHTTPTFVERHQTKYSRVRRLTLVFFRNLEGIFRHTVTVELMSES